MRLVQLFLIKLFRVSLVGTAFLFSLFSSEKRLEAFTNQKLLAYRNKRENSLVLKHANELFGAEDNFGSAAHSSHSSHGSHTSHYSSTVTTYVSPATTSILDTTSISILPTTTVPTTTTTSIPTTTSTVQPTTTTTSIPTTTSTQPTTTTTTTITPSTTTTVNAEIIVDFVGSPNVGEAPLEVKFTNLCKGNIEKYQWDFGDGSISTEENQPTHTYTKWGAYSVILTAYASDGTSKQEIKQDYVVVSPPCAFLSSLDNQNDINTLRKFRDSRLNNNISGLFIKTIYYQNSAEVVSILFRHPELKEKMKNLAQLEMSKINELILNKTATVSEDTIDEIILFLNELKPYGSPKLQKYIELVIKGISNRYLLEGMGIKIE